MSFRFVLNNLIHYIYIIIFMRAYISDTSLSYLVILFTYSAYIPPLMHHIYASAYIQYCIYYTQIQRIYISHSYIIYTFVYPTVFYIYDCLIFSLFVSQFGHVSHTARASKIYCLFRSLDATEWIKALNKNTRARRAMMLNAKIVVLPITVNRSTLIALCSHAQLPFLLSVLVRVVICIYTCYIPIYMYTYMLKRFF